MSLFMSAPPPNVRRSIFLDAIALARKVVVPRTRQGLSRFADKSPRSGHAREWQGGRGRRVVAVMHRLMGIGNLDAQLIEALFDAPQHLTLDRPLLERPCFQEKFENYRRIGELIDTEHFRIVEN